MRKFLSLFAAVLVALVANAAVINITNETPDALRIALGNAETGDIIEMAAGTYVESNSNYIAFDGKEVIVRAAEGAEVLIQPQVPITIANGALAKFENIKFDASRLVELATWYEHLIYATDASANNRLIMEGCELYGFNLNKSAIYCSTANALDAVTLNNCYIHDCMKSILFVENTSNAINVQVTNSTFANISTNTESYWAGVMDVRASGANLLVDHCTFYNVIPMNTDYSCVSKITLANGVTSNCIFMLPTAQDNIRAMRGVTATNCITYNYLKDSGTGIHSSVTKVNCVQEDPLFVDAANGNFTLGEGSPALTMNDGQPIGDPRWVPSVEPVEPLMKTIYCKMAQDWWKADGAAVGIYAWGDNSAQLAAWPGVRMAPVEGEADLWSFELDINTYKNCIFTRVNASGDIQDWGAKTANLTIPTDENDLYTITSETAVWGDPGVTGEWSKYVPAAPVEMTAIYDWAGEIGATIFGGNSNITTGTIKIHENTDNVNGIKFGSSYVYADGKWIAIKPAEGGFKAGDVLSVSVVFNNSDATKYCMADVYAADGATRMFRSDSASTLNGRNAGEPIVQTYTLASDQDSLFLGRYGNTGMFITLLKVERAAGDEPQPQGCNWDNIEFLDGPAEYANQFKVCKPENVGVVNIQQPGFATEIGIYMTFPSAVFGTISLSESAYDIQGAGIIFHLSAFTEEYTEVTVNCDGNDLVFTVYNANGGTPQPAHTYTVAGSSDVAFGSAWAPANTANDMEMNDDGIYVWEKAELTLAAGVIEFKVCEDHAWTNCWPSSNYQLNIPEAGIYTIWIHFDPANGNTVTAEATKTGSAVVLPTIAMHGNFLGSWADTENFTIAEGDATASLTLNIAAGNYEFGMRIGGSGNWTANGAAFTRENASHVIEAGQGNLTLAADEAGEYTFTWTFATNTLAITFPEGGEPYVPVHADGYYLVGSFNEWTPAEAYMFAPNEGAEGEYQLAVTLTEGAELKVVKSESDILTWYGANNYVVPAEFGREVIIYFRPEANQEWSALDGHIYIAIDPQTGINNTEDGIKAVKVLRDGQILIMKGDKTYNVMGAIVR